MLTNGRKIKIVFFFRFTDRKTFQSIFNDKTEIILNSDSKTTVYVDKNKTRYIFHTNAVMKSSNKEMVEKLKYIKKILENMLKENKKKKNTIHDE